MHAFGFIGAPLAVFAAFSLVGLGLAVTLGARFAPDAQAALAPILGFSIFATTSVLLSLGVPAIPLGLTVLVLPSVLTVALRRRVYPVFRASGRPVAVGLVALFLAAAPNLADGNWTVRTYFGHQTDSYFWVSQARSFFDGPPKAPSSTYPDRLAYERVAEQHWAVALPFVTGEAAWLSGSDPADTYGLIAAFVASLLPLAAFFCARGCLEWRPNLATCVGLALAVNASLLFASYYSWQQQLVGTALGLVSLAALRLALESPRSWRLQITAAFLAAAALASYRMAFAPYFAAMIAVVVGAYLVSHSSLERRQALRSLVGFAGLALAFAAVSVVALVNGLHEFLTLGVDTSFKRQFPTGNLTEALGFFPRMFGAGFAWGVLAACVALPLFIVPLARLRRSSAPRVDFVLGTTLALVAAYAFLLATKALTPYTSFKLLAYGTPFFAFVVFGAAWLKKPTRARAAGVAGLVLLLGSSTLVALIAGSSESQSVGGITRLADIAPELGQDTVSVRVIDPWEQAWATYYLRDVPLSVEQPSLVLVGVSMLREPSIYRHPGATYVLREGSGGSVWNGGGLALDRRDTLASPVSSRAKERPQPGS